jgi:hypothetical protein
VVLAPVNPDRDVVDYFGDYVIFVEERESQGPPWQPMTEDSCFCCKDGGDLLECDWNRGCEHQGSHMCPKVYHEGNCSAAAAAALALRLRC